MKRPKREPVHYGPISQCRTHKMTQGCEGGLPDCLVEKVRMAPPTFGFTTEREMFVELNQEVEENREKG